MMGEKVEKKLYDAASKGHVITLEELLEESPYLVYGVPFACSRNLLHIATMCGQLGIVEEVLKINPQLARNLDSQKSSPLRIAAAQGHVEIAKKLLSAAPEMCWWRDDQGMNPVHIAAMNGHVDILEELLQLDLFPAMERVHRGQTVLHLCVKHRQLRAFEVLVEKLSELVYAEDDDGETVLHSAVRFKQVEVVKYLEDHNKMEKLSTNSKGKTLRQISRESSPDAASLEIEEILIQRTSSFHDSIEFLGKMSNVTMVVVVLIATMAFQAAVNPPGGVWQDDDDSSSSSSSHKAGEAIMASNRPKIFKNFKLANTVAFGSSLVTIFVLTTGLPSKHPFFTTAVVYTMWASLASIAVSYGASIMMITPNMESQSLAYVIKVVVIVSMSFYGTFYIGSSVVKLHSWMKSRNRWLEASRLDPQLQSRFSSLLQFAKSRFISYTRCGSPSTL